MHLCARTMVNSFSFIVSKILEKMLLRVNASLRRFSLLFTPISRGNKLTKYREKYTEFKRYVTITEIYIIYKYIHIVVDANDNTRISHVSKLCSGSSLPWHRVRNFFTACMLQNTAFSERELV